MPERTCIVTDCETPMKYMTLGLCKKHYYRQTKRGTTDLPKGWKRTAPETRFWAAVPAGLTDDECWSWQGTTSSAGYGVFWTGDAQAKAYRWAYEHLIGPIPVGLGLDHLCHSRSTTCAGGNTCLHRRCVNPRHLEPVSNTENVMRGLSFATKNARKTRCPRGHEYDVVNTYIPPKGGRTCRTCYREYNRKRQRRIHAQKAS